jgi:hypothetical protein
MKMIILWHQVSYEFQILAISFRRLQSMIVVAFARFVGGHQSPIFHPNGLGWWIIVIILSWKCL